MAEFDQCSVCHEKYSHEVNNPKTPIQSLSCPHGLCIDCIRNIQVVETEKRNGRVAVNLKCPVCMTEKAFRADRMIPNLGLCAALAAIRDAQSVANPATVSPPTDNQFTMDRADRASSPVHCDEISSLPLSVANDPIHKNEYTNEPVLKREDTNISLIEPNQQTDTPFSLSSDVNQAVVEDSDIDDAENRDLSNVLPTSVTNSVTSQSRKKRKINDINNDIASDNDSQSIVKNEHMRDTIDRDSSAVSPSDSETNDNRRMSQRNRKRPSFFHDDFRLFTKHSSHKNSEENENTPSSSPLEPDNAVDKRRTEKRDNDDNLFNTESSDDDGDLLLHDQQSTAAKTSNKDTSNTPENSENERITEKIQNNDNSMNNAESSDEASFSHNQLSSTSKSSQNDTDNEESLDVITNANTVINHESNNLNETSDNTITINDSPAIVKTEKTVFAKLAQNHRHYGDRVLLARQSRQGIMKLGGGNCTMELYPGPNNTNHPRFRDIGYIHAMWYNDSWQPFGPKYAGQPWAHVSCVPVDNAPFGVFMRRRTMGTEYCGDYRLADPEESVEMYTAAYCLKKKDLTKMLKDMKQSLSSPRGEWHRSIKKWRHRLTRALEEDNSPAAPTWMIEKRQPTEDERREKTPSLAARARALGFHSEMSNEMLAEIMLKIDEFHSSVPIVFVEYSEKIYDYVKDGETTKNAMGKKRGIDECCAKASDWYSMYDQEL